MFTCKRLIFLLTSFRKLKMRRVSAHRLIEIDEVASGEISIQECNNDNCCWKLVPLRRKWRIVNCHSPRGGRKMETQLQIVDRVCMRPLKRASEFLAPFQWDKQEFLFFPALVLPLFPAQQTKEREAWPNYARAFKKRFVWTPSWNKKK